MVKKYISYLQKIRIPFLKKDALLIRLNDFKNANLNISLSFLKFNNLLIPKIIINNLN